MRIAWLAPYPTSLFARQLRIPPKSQHPAPWLQMLSSKLAEIQGIDLHIITFTNEIDYYKSVELNNINFHFLPTEIYPKRVVTRFTKDVSNAKKILSKLNPDVVHAHGTEDAYALSGLAYTSNCIVSIQGIMIECLKARGFQFDLTNIFWYLTSITEKIAICKGKFFITRTNFDKSFVMAHQANARISEIWEMIRPEFFSADKSRKSTNVLFFVGSLSNFKGVRDLLNAFSLLKNEFSDLALKIVGSGNRKNTIKYQNLVRELSIDESIEWLGFLNASQIAKLYANGGIFVAPSWMENSSNSVCEAMLAGIPVVATDVGGLKTIINSKSTGILVPPKNPHALAEGIAILLKNENLRQTIANNAQKVARKRHDPLTILQKTSNLYSEVSATSDKIFIRS